MSVNHPVRKRSITDPSLLLAHQLLMSVWTPRFCLPLVKYSFQTWVSLMLFFQFGTWGSKDCLICCRAEAAGLIGSADRDLRSFERLSSDRSVSQMSANVLTPGVAGLMSVSVAIGGLVACGQLYLQQKSLQRVRLRSEKRIEKILSPAAEKKRWEKYLPASQCEYIVISRPCIPALNKHACKLPFSPGMFTHWRSILNTSENIHGVNVWDKSGTKLMRLLFYSTHRCHTHTHMLESISKAAFFTCLFFSFF